MLHTWIFYCAKLHHCIIHESKVTASQTFSENEVHTRYNAISASLYKVRHQFTPDILKLLIQIHLFPHILYCLSVWGGAAQIHMHRVQKAINFAARVVTSVRRYEHVSPALKTLGWQKVGDLVASHDCMQVYRALNVRQAPESLRCMFVPRGRVSTRETRAVRAGELELPMRRLTQSQSGFSYRAVGTWNRLPLSTRLAPSRSAFVSALERDHTIT